MLEPTTMLLVFLITKPIFLGIVLVMLSLRHKARLAAARPLELTGDPMLSLPMEHGERGRKPARSPHPAPSPSTKDRPS